MGARNSVPFARSRTSSRAVDVARLWAPWRSTFFSQPRPRRCIFCAAHASRHDRLHRVIDRGRHVFALLNLYPYSNGHVLIAPARHVGMLDALRTDEWEAMLHLATRVMKRLTRTLRAQGFNLGINLGVVAGAGIPGHLHVHIVPRWRGDSNFMPVITNTRVISQSLDELYRLLTLPIERGTHAKR